MTNENSEQKKLSDYAQIEQDRADRFTWKPGDLVFYSSREECEKAAAKEGRKVIWYD